MKRVPTRYVVSKKGPKQLDKTIYLWLDDTRKVGNKGIPHVIYIRQVALSIKCILQEDQCARVGTILLESI